MASDFALEPLCFVQSNKSFASDSCSRSLQLPCVSQCTRCKLLVNAGNYFLTICWLFSLITSESFFFTFLILLSITFRAEQLVRFRRGNEITLQDCNWKISLLVSSLPHCERPRLCWSQFVHKYPVALKLQFSPTLSLLPWVSVSMGRWVVLNNNVMPSPTVEAGMGSKSTHYKLQCQDFVKKVTKLWSSTVAQR